MRTPNRFETNRIESSTFPHSTLLLLLFSYSYYCFFYNITQLSTTEIAKMVSKAWKTLPEEEREKWEEMARKDKVRYETEKSLYKGPWKVPINTKTTLSKTTPTKTTPTPTRTRSISSDDCDRDLKIMSSSRLNNIMMKSVVLNTSMDTSTDIISESKSLLQLQNTLKMQNKLLQKTLLASKLKVQNTLLQNTSAGLKLFSKGGLSLNPDVFSMSTSLTNNTIVSDDSSVYSIASDSIPTTTTNPTTTPHGYTTKMASDIFSFDCDEFVLPNEITSSSNSNNGQQSALSAASIIMAHHSNFNNRDSYKQLQQSTSSLLGSSQQQNFTTAADAYYNTNNSNFNGIDCNNRFGNNLNDNDNIDIFALPNNTNVNQHQQQQQHQHNNNNNSFNNTTSSHHFVSSETLLNQQQQQQPQSSTTINSNFYNNCNNNNNHQDNNQSYQPQY